MPASVRLLGRDGAEVDAVVAARLLRDFNDEYGDPAPDPRWLADRVRALTSAGDTAVLILSEEAEDRGVAVLRFRDSLWEDAAECYLAELYVVPVARGRGLGEALLRECMAHARFRGCTFMDLVTTDADVAAVRLYERLGFDRHERRGDAVSSWYFERDL